MNSLLAQPSPPRRGKNRGNGDASKPSRGGSRGSRGKKSGSRLASTRPINGSDLTASSTPDLGDGEELSSDFESSEEPDAARFQRFNAADPSNQYEQVSSLLSAF
jgi:hypothetical protein